jgi:molybdenum cofactor biosynthesis enzyme MoaA
MTFRQVKAFLQESVALGVKEYYFTGGEPFLHRDMVAILVETLQYGPATVLTNGTVFKDGWLRELREADRTSLYSLEFRVSIDGFSPEMNDPIRGLGTFERAMRGVMQLVAHDFLPIITAARTWALEDEQKIIENFVNVLRDQGYARPRLKILPTLQIGAETQRTHGYRTDERVTQSMMDGYDVGQLICEHSRIVTDRGVHVCPILIEQADSLLGTQLHDAHDEYVLRHGACFTCYQYGAICANPTSGGKGVGRTL